MFISLRPEHAGRQIAATRHCNKFHRVNRRILSKILLPQQNVVAATCRTKLNWFDFVATTCYIDKILVSNLGDMLQRQNSLAAKKS